ncbi:MAG: RagB/SusD family nutrient uptake outer membrane protein, partial [Bacteroidales bacterium]
MMKKIAVKIFFLLGIVSCFPSCDFDLDKENPNSVTVENFYKTEDDLTNAVNATYAVLQDATLVAREWFFIHHLRGDDMATGGGQLETPRYQVLIGTNDPANFVAKSVWNGWYAVIHRANVVIEKAADISMDSETRRERLVGEAKFLRAWAYFDLVSLWGGVPLYNEYVKDLSGSNPRATVDEVYASIISNLQDAIAALPLNYSGENIGRATQGAARAMLAKVYMQQGDYASAKNQLQEIIDSNQYWLVDNYNDNFLEETEYNAESVFEVGFMDSNSNFNWGNNNGDAIGQETTLHNQEVCPISWANLIPSESLLEEFESTDVAGNIKTDPRYKFSFYEVGDMIVTGPLTEDQFNIVSSSVRGGAPKK